MRGRVRGHEHPVALRNILRNTILLSPGLHRNRLVIEPSVLHTANYYPAPIPPPPPPARPTLPTSSRCGVPQLGGGPGQTVLGWWPGQAVLGRAAPAPDQAQSPRPRSGLRSGHWRPAGRRGTLGEGAGGQGAASRRGPGPPARGVDPPLSRGDGPGGAHSQARRPGEAGPAADWSVGARVSRTPHSAGNAPGRTRQGGELEAAEPAQALDAVLATKEHAGA